MRPPCLSRSPTLTPVWDGTTSRLLKKWQYPDEGAELRPAPAFLDKATDRQGEAVEAEEEFG